MCWQQVFPRWQEHWTSNKVYDGDMIVLQGQEKVFLSKLKENGTDVNKEYTKLTFTPTQADRFVLAFRNWLRRHGNSQPEWFGSTDNQPLPSTVLSKRQVPILRTPICYSSYDPFSLIPNFHCHQKHTTTTTTTPQSQTSIQTIKYFLELLLILNLHNFTDDGQIRTTYTQMFILQKGLLHIREVTKVTDWLSSGMLCICRHPCRC